MYLVNLSSIGKSILLTPDTYEAVRNLIDSGKVKDEKGRDRESEDYIDGVNDICVKDKMFDEINELLFAKKKKNN